ncbi:MAG: type I DNA topoisomerase [Bacteroidota bacterium]
MAKNLVIVESPAKAKTIEKFLGKDFVVTSCYGHIRDLSKKTLGIDIENGFNPKYEVPADKTKIITELKKMAKEAEIVWLATDEDREGEAISWHLLESLKLDEAKTKRIVFHEITKTAITEAIEHPRMLDRFLVDAQQARRVLDRLVGFELSPLLWKKVKPSLSAGRVQSVAVRLIVERENEIKEFKISYSYRVAAEFEITGSNEKHILKAGLSQKLPTREEAEDLLKRCANAAFAVENTEVRPSKKSPAPPFTTSTLQQEASRKLGFSVAKTMLIAQQLYEEGKITYMRTDSVNLSNMALAMAKEEITKTFGDNYVKTRNYVTRSKGAQEAHEAIRPTYMNAPIIKGNSDQRRLYELIYKRTLASQMSDAQLERTLITIGTPNVPEKFVAEGEVIKFDGFLKVYMESSDDEVDETPEGLLPAINIGEKLGLIEMTATQRFSQHPPRYTEASLVKKLEELGIGRPSTFAPTISTIQKRNYVVNETREGTSRYYVLLSLKNGVVEVVEKTEITGYEKSKLFPTDIGSLVNYFLVEHFGNILDFQFTATVEKEFDEIAAGRKKWNKMIDEFYWPFHKQVTETTETTRKVSGERLLGIDPATQKNVYVKIGRFGPVVQLGETDGELKPRFAGLLKNQSIETISLEDALSLFRLPRNLGPYNEKDVVVSVGKFGPYALYNSAFYSLRKTDNPITITLEEAIIIIEEKLLKQKNKVIREFEEDKTVKVLNGRWGPYIVADGENVKIPKGMDPQALTLAECLAIAKDAAKPKEKVKKSTKSKKS